MKQSHLAGRILICLIVASGSQSCTSPSANSTASERSSTSKQIHFYTDPNKKSEDPEENLTYGLFITPPWKNGGDLYMNFPEHLEYNPVGNTILRHYDSIPNPWTISPDGKQASYRVESLALKDVFVESFARVMDDVASLLMLREYMWP